ncbi:hypothetical protein ABH935_008054 [Catenulispora sp. GAS73]|uniref:hypothetical protein n=1 Tax=Catenulispora sp. GAS73 TaxID=3156269 RepID=UPI0035176D05
MAMICLVSAKNSPGVTTTAVALAEAWPRPVLLAECDPRYGDIVAGYQQGGGDVAKGLLGLAAIHQHTDIRQEVFRYVQPLSPSSPARFLAGVQVPAQAAAVSVLWEPLSRVLPALVVKRRTVDVLVDCGPLHAAHAPLPLIQHADLVLMVTGDHLEQIRAAHDAVGTITERLAAARPHADPRWCLAGVVIPPGARRHNEREAIEQALDIDVIAEVRHDLKVGAELLGRRNLPNGYSRSGYMRDIRELQAAIDRQLNRPAPPARTVASNHRLTVVPGEAAHAG